jgi:hypothetical protein
LREHPSEVEDFLDYFHVSQRKLMLACNSTMGAGTVSADMASDIEARYAEVKDRFLISSCDKCGTKRLNHTWSKLDFVAMANKTPLGRLIVPGYFLPLRQAHATVASMVSRMTAGPNESISFRDSAQRKEADQALRIAHNILLDVLRVQNEHFSVPGLKEQNEACLQDFIDIWQTPKP